MAKWEELPIADRAAYMRVAVKNGYRDIRSIREAYNKYAEGGYTTEEDLNDSNNSPHKTPQRSYDNKKRFWETEEEYKERMKTYNSNFAEQVALENRQKNIQDSINREEYIKTPEGKARYNRIKSEDASTFNNLKVHHSDSSALDKVASTVDSINESNNEKIKALQEELKAAAENRQQEIDNKTNEYKLMIKSLEKAAELGFSGTSILGAISNYRKWQNSTGILKPIANWLQKAQFPSQIGGTLIDVHQSIDAFQNGDTAEGIYNGVSGILGGAGSIGSLDIFRGNYPKVDRFLDASGLTQNVLDYAKFGIETATGKDSIFDLFRNEDNKYGNGGEKKTKVKKVGPTYNPNTRTWTNAKGQNITGRSFKGNYGTTTYLESGAVDLDKGDFQHEYRYAPNARRVYIGGNKNEVRQKYLDMDTEFTNAIKQAARQYGISANVLASRIAREGPIDDNIQHYNNTNGYYKRGEMNGIIWGLDDLGTMISEGTVQAPKNVHNLFTDAEMENEHGRTTYSVSSDSFLDGVSITAAGLQYFKNEMKKKYPKATDAQLEQYATAAFNMGISKAVDLINKGQIKDAYKPFIKLKRDGGLLL